MKKIIVFHEINNLKKFENTIKLIIDNFDCLTLDELFEKNKDNSCHITFDDGHHSFSEAYNILKKYNIPVSLFISINKIINKENFWFQDIEELMKILGNKFNEEFYRHFKKKFNNAGDFFCILKNLKISQINLFINAIKLQYKLPVRFMNITEKQLTYFLKENLITLGAHTDNHPILSNEDDETSKFEISNSIEILEKYINQKVTSFAYPNGISDLDFSLREKNNLKNIGIKYALTMNFNNIDKKEVDLLELPRISLSENLIKNFFKVKFTNNYKYLYENFNINSENRKRRHLKNFKFF